VSKIIFKFFFIFFLFIILPILVFSNDKNFYIFLNLGNNFLIMDNNLKKARIYNFKKDNDELFISSFITDSYNNLFLNLLKINDDGNNGLYILKNSIDQSNFKIKFYTEFPVDYSTIKLDNDNSIFLFIQNNGRLIINKMDDKFNKIKEINIRGESNRTELSEFYNIKINGNYLSFIERVNHYNLGTIRQNLLILNKSLNDGIAIGQDYTNFLFSDNFIDDSKLYLLFYNFNSENLYLYIYEIDENMKLKLDDGFRINLVPLDVIHYTVINNIVLLNTKEGIVKIDLRSKDAEFYLINKEKNVNSDINVLLKKSPDIIPYMSANYISNYSFDILNKFSFWDYLILELNGQLKNPLEFINFLLFNSIVVKTNIPKDLIIKDNSYELKIQNIKNINMSGFIKNNNNLVKDIKVDVKELNIY
jgi:hypothetical protein